MAICDLGHEHPDPVEVPVPVPVDPGPNENDVRIEEIRSATEVQLAEVRADERIVEMSAEMERMRGELDGMRETLALLSPPAPEPQPEPVVIPVTPPPGGADGGDSLPDVPKPPKSRSGKSGWFSGYR